MQNLISGVVANIDLVNLMLRLVIATLCAIALGVVIKRFSSIVGDRSQFTLIFLLLIPTMVLIISIVKSSLALSLGLVGALSIVRFRTPIKEPQELLYLFLAIAIGLGLGADQIMPTLVTFTFILAVFITYNHFHIRQNPKGIYIDISTQQEDSINISSLAEIFENHNVQYDLQRYNEYEDKVSASYHVVVDSTDQSQNLINSLRELMPEGDLSIINRSRQLN